MDIFDTIERLKYISSLINLDTINSTDKEQISNIKEIKKLIKT